MGPWDHK